MRSFSFRRRTPATPPTLILPPAPMAPVTHDPRQWMDETYASRDRWFPGSQRGWVRRAVDDHQSGR